MGAPVLWSHVVCVVVAMVPWALASPTIHVDPWGSNAVRVRIPIGSAVLNPDVQALLPDPPSSIVGSVHRSISDGAAVTTNGNIRVTVGASSELSVSRVSDGKVLLGGGTFAYGPGGKGAPSGWMTGTLSFAANNGERVYGLGEHRTGRVQNKPISIDFQRSQVYTFSTGADISIPFYTSSLGYGFLWNSPSFGSVILNETITQWSSNATQQIDFWVVTTPGNTTSTVSPYPPLLSAYVDVTGHQPTMPHFASGFWQSKNRYRNQTQLLDIARGYVDRGLPISVIVIDFFNWVHFGDWSFNAACWPDPEGMVQQLADWGIQVMVSVWPQVGTASFNYEPMEKQGFLVTGDDGEPKIIENSRYLYDAFNPDARAFVFDAVSKGYLKYGIQTYWLDADEPERQAPDESGEYHYHAGQDTQVGMAYPREHQRMAAEGLVGSNITMGNFIMLSRSAWAGSARHGTAVWSGDIDSTFPELTIQVRVAQNVAMSGIFWWTTDIGGYRGGNITSPVFRELIVRWFQFGAFCPLFRLHGNRLGGPPANSCGYTNNRNEVWEFGEVAYPIIAGVMRLRENLRSYVEKHLAVASDTGLPLLRPMFLEFPGSEVACAGGACDGQYMFGPDWLVSPVTEYQKRTWDVYLPALPPNQTWSYFYSATNKQYAGGQWLRSFPAPLDEFPLFVRTRDFTLAA